MPDSDERTWREYLLKAAGTSWSLTARNAPTLSCSAEELYQRIWLESDAKEIRVLDLLPGRFGTTRVISLEAVPVPAYEALSYT